MGMGRATSVDALPVFLTWHLSSYSLGYASAWHYLYCDNHHCLFLHQKESATACRRRRGDNADRRHGEKGGEKLKKSAGNSGLFWALLIFVGIPLPGTGAWTGTLAASLLNIDFKTSILAVTLGVLLAGIIMSLGSKIVSALGWAGVVGIIAIIAIIIIISIILKKKNNKN